MSDTNETTTTTQEPVDPEVTSILNEGDTSDATPENPEPVTDQETDDQHTPSRREAKYRLQLRETEAERDTLRSTLEAMRRAEVERLAAEHIVKPAALWTAGIELASLVGENGTVDPELVRAAALNARQQLGLEDPQARRKNSPVVPQEGMSLHTSEPHDPWQSAFKG